MTTSFRESTELKVQRNNAKPWKIATIGLALSTAILGFMLVGEKQDNHDMSMQADSTHGAHYDHAFINMMIPHHQQAIDEANNALKNAQHPELKQLAQNIIKSQQAEIDQMKQWRKNWYGD